MPPAKDQVKAVFLAALDRATLGDRTAFLDQACGPDAVLRQRVEALLQAHDRTNLLLDRPAADHLDGKQTALGEATVSDEQPEVVAGRYTLLEPIGEGGMGTVWMAQQTEPVRRKVALKVIKPGMDSKRVIARFEAERQALALMDHPHIARVLDGGTTEAGRPFFVMEYVKGVPITQYCDEHRLSIAERLALFVPVCHAVQHAHTKGVIHRDLKPSNILVCLYDATPVPKVIDFGLAKAIHEPLTEHTLHTGHGVVIGTPLYMSPEQAGFNNLDVDTRTDVYSLGVLLYELLTGTTPLQQQRFQAAAVHEMLRLIREEDPPLPSMRVNSSATLPLAAARRQQEPVKLTRLIRGELDWIVMKALDKDRNRRYETANSFAQDVQRYLAGEPVLAAPPSAAYRLRKFARKHRAVLATTATIFLLLVAGVAVSTWQAVRATRAQKAETERAEGERLAKEEAQHERDAKERERKYAQAIAEFVKDDFLALTSVEGQWRFGGAAGPLGKDPTLRQLLDRAAQKLNQRDDLSPRTEAELRWIIGVSYRAMGEAGLAIPFLERSVALRKEEFGSEHQETLSAQNSLGVAIRADGRLAQALSLFEENLKLSQAKLGADHPLTLDLMTNLASSYELAGRLDLALPLYEETLKRRRASLGDDHPLTHSSMNHLARGYQATGQMNRALPLYEETLKRRKATLGADHPSTCTSMHNLAWGYQAVGKLDRALPLFEEAVKGMKAAVGADHPDTLLFMNNLAGGYQAAGQTNRVLPLLEEIFKRRKATLGADHPDTLESMNNLGVGYQAARKLDLALPLYEETLKRRKATLGADHPSTLTSMCSLALGYQAAGQMNRALPLLEETLKRRKATLGADHPDTLESMNCLGMGYYDARKLDPRKLDLALPLYEEALKLYKARLGPDHLDTLLVLYNLAVGYGFAGKLDQALPLFQEAVAGMEKRRFQSEWADKLVHSLIDCHEELKQFDQAETWRRKWLAVLKERSGPESLPYSIELSVFGITLLEQKKWTDAEAVLRECLAIREKKEPDEWRVCNTRSMLGAALLGQNKHTDAEPLLLKGYEGMKQRAAGIPGPIRKARLTEAVERLIALYEATGQSEEAARWRKELP